ncbi:MAG: uroporphyrinogen-III synthase [Deltaproteobacteria bacterium]|nr:uroporphyrinogen-III synthase [Deltaproteobacteria bacterium]
MPMDSNTSTNTRAGLQGLRIVCFESRRAKEMAELIRRYGGEPIAAPSMREVPLSENRAALELLPRIEKGEFDILILMTGVGTKTLNETLLTQFSQERILDGLRKVQLVARGPKPVAALKELTLTAQVMVPEPNTWREILSTLDGAMDMRGKRIAIQEYGISNPELIASLQERGAMVASIPIYRWALPEDVAPLRAAIQRILGGEADVALFTNGAQVDHLFQFAGGDKAADALRQAFKNIIVGSVGPVCTQVLEQFGLKPDIEPVHPKMGALIAEVAARAREALSTK